MVLGGEVPISNAISFLSVVLLFPFWVMYVLRFLKKNFGCSSFLSPSNIGIDNSTVLGSLLFVVYYSLSDDFFDFFVTRL